MAAPTPTNLTTEAVVADPITVPHVNVSGSLVPTEGLLWPRLAR